MIDLMKIFDGYVRNYHTLNLTVHHGKHSYTMSEIEYFARLGSMLGYYPFTEDTVNNTNRAMDLTWWDDYDGEGWNTFVLHLERENFFSKDAETLDKLFCSREHKPRYVIGIMNVQNTKRIDQLLRIAKRKSDISNSLLIFRTYSNKVPQRYFDQVHAYTLKGNEVKKHKQAHVSLVESTLFMHFAETLDILTYTGQPHD